MDKVATNLTKLAAIWERAAPMLPTGPSRGTTVEYEDLARSWRDLLQGLPPIDSWTITEDLPDQDGLGQTFLDYAEIGEPPFGALEWADKPGRDLGEYRYRLNRARRRAVRARLGVLSDTVDAVLPCLVSGVGRDSRDVLVADGIASVRAAVNEIERLLGDTVTRSGRWADLHRHMRFGEGHDWHDIAEFDWPSVRSDIEAAWLEDADPIPVPLDDLGAAASANPTGGVTTALNWTALDDDGFERLLFDLLRGLGDYQNVEWLMKTRAPDRGRDLSLERLVRDSGGSVRTERVIVQAKHWTSRSVPPAELFSTLANISSWEPPPVRAIIVATSGRFTADAVTLAENHNADSKMPLIELWPDSRLETLLARRPDLVITHGLRG